MKRFTDTEKWRDPWFRKLTLQHRIFWLFILDACDKAGVWEVDIDMAAFCCGVEFSQEELLHVFQGRIRDLGNGKWWIEKFIAFQYKQLDPACYPHMLVIELVKKHNLPVQTTLPTTLPTKVVRRKRTTLPPTLPGRVKEEDKDKEEDKEEGGTRGKPANREQVLSFVRELGLPETDGHYCFDHWEGNGYRNSGKAILDWKATIRSWKSANILPSLRKGFRPSTFQPPLIAEDTRRKINELRNRRREVKFQPNFEQNDSARAEYAALSKQIEQLEGTTT
jgi:hypothetical protein